MKRHPYRNRLGLPVISAILTIAASLAAAGLVVVVSKNRVRAIGEEQRKVETEMHLISSEILALNNKIEALLTRDRVQPRLTSAGTLLRPITRHSLLGLKPLPAPPAPATTTPSVTTAIAQHTPAAP